MAILDRAAAPSRRRQLGRVKAGPLVGATGRPANVVQMVQALQRAAGNRAVARSLAAGGVSLHGETNATYDGGRSRVSMRSLRRNPPSVDCPDDQPGLRATGTLTITYSADVTIRMPGVPDGLSACQERRVRAFLRDVLRPHEQDHARRFRTYNGSTRRAFDLTGCGREAITEQLQALHDREAAERQARADQLSAAIDPFNRDIDLDCE